VIAPIMTEPGGPAWRQTTFHPFAITSRLARGETLELKLDCPTYDTAGYGAVPIVDAVATCDAESGETSVFLVNRSLDEEVTIDIDVRLLGSVQLGRVESLHDDDIHAANTLQDQDRVQMRPNESARLHEGTVTITLPAVSWTALTLA
jgi:alpha-N-arabinofuranosidase